MRLFLLALLALSIAASCSAWSPPPIAKSASTQTKSPDRREFLTSLIVGSATPFLISSPAVAAPSQEQKDKDNIVKGYNRLQYLLDNWEAETTVCKTGQEVSDHMMVHSYNFSSYHTLLHYLSWRRQHLVIGVSAHQQK